MRLFVAVNLPHDEKLRLAAVLEQLRAMHAPVRWLDHDTLHITLQFLGEVPETEVPAITAALDRCVPGISPFDVDVSGFGAFPSLSRPRVFWIGVKAPPQLMTLQQNVQRELQRLGFVPEERAWSPHLTIGRTSNNARVDRAQVDRMQASVEYKTVFRVHSVDLMRSHLGRGGARYERIHAAKLT